MNPDKDIVPFVNPDTWNYPVALTAGGRVGAINPDKVNLGGWDPSCDARLGATSSISAYVPRRPAS